MLDQAFEALKTYDWGVDPKVLQPITDAIVSSHGNPAARKDLESRLAAALQGAAPRAAKDSICRMLQTIGTAASVPPLAALLPEATLSHMARYALERIPAPEAGRAMIDALPKVNGKLRIGIIASLGARRETAAVAPLQSLLADADSAVGRAAAQALGVIGSPEAGKALAEAKPNEGTNASVADASLACAETLLADGKTAEARAVYQQLLGRKPPKPVEEAATRGLQACAGK